ncbi:MAG: arginyltransferase [Nannocystaceae bacterium]
MGTDTRRLRLLDVDPPELLVYDEAGACPYLDDTVARLPMRLPIRPLGPTEFERKLEAGDRRQGILLYNPRCPSCQACEPIRIDVTRFAPSKSQRRAFRRGLRHLEMTITPTSLTDEKVTLYNAHKSARNLMGTSDLIDAAGYNAFLVDSCVDSFEMQYRAGDQLVAVAIVDRGERSLSAVYTYFDPAFEYLSPGVFSIMMQIDYARRRGLQYLYLGLFVEDCDAMRYKSSYLPHERRVGDRWVEFDREE